VIDRVLDAVDAGQHGLERRVGIGRLGVVGVGGDLTAAGDEYEAAIGRGLHLEEHPVVRLFEDDLIDGGTDAMKPDLVRAVGLVEGRVVHGGGVGGPGSRVVGAGYLCGQVLPALEIPDPQAERLAPVRVEGIGQQAMVGRDGEDADREILVTLGEVVGVQQRLLGSVRPAPQPDEDRVLTALLGATGVPPVVPLGGCRQIGQLGSGDDLLEDLTSKRRQMSEDGLRVVVLG
jgi:hypothetical protein